MKKILFPAAIAAAFFSLAILPSCKKDDDGGRAAQIIGSWRINQVGTDTNGNGVWDANERRPLGADTVGSMQFHGDGTGSYDLTYAGIPMSVPTKWSLQNGDNDLQLITTFFTVDTTTMNIVVLNGTDLELRNAGQTPASYMGLKKQ